MEGFNIRHLLKISLKKLMRVVRINAARWQALTSSMQIKVEKVNDTKNTNKCFRRCSFVTIKRKNKHQQDL